MNILDIIIGIPLLWAIYRGFTKGFIIEISTLIALILGIWGTVHFSDFTANIIREELNFNSDYLKHISFVLTFLIIVVTINLIARTIEKLIEAVSLGIINRLLGAGFCLIKTGLIVSVLVYFISFIDTNNSMVDKQTKEDSILYVATHKVADELFTFLDFENPKQKVLNKINKGLKEIKI